MPDINDPAETKSIAPSTSRVVVPQSLSVVRRGLALANALLRRQDAEVYYKSGREKVSQAQSAGSRATGGVWSARATSEVARQFSRAGEKDYRQAVEDFTRAIEIDPDFAEAYQSRAFCFAHLREYQKELQDREVVIRLRPHDASAYGLRGRLHEFLGNSEEALRDHMQAIELAPEKAANRYRWRGDLLNSTFR